MDNVIRPSFRNSEKRKAKALRQSLMEVQSFGSHSPDCGSPFFTFSPGVFSSISPSVVERYLRSSDQKKSPHHHEQPPASKKKEATPLFVSQNNTYFIASADHEPYPRNVGLFGYSCQDDSSLASPLRCINGGSRIDMLNNTVSLPVRDDKTSEKLQNVKKQLNFMESAFLLDTHDSDSDSVQELSPASSIDGCLGTSVPTMVARTVYVNKQGEYNSDSDIDVVDSSSKILSSQPSSSSSTDDGTLHDKWLIEDMADDMTVESSQSHKSDMKSNDGLKHAQ